MTTPPPKATQPENPILNSPYYAPSQHWQLSDSGELMQIAKEGRRQSVYYVPVTRKARRGGQTELDLSTPDAEGQAFRENALVNGIRVEVDKWRRSQSQQHLTHETQRLLQHWREGHMSPPPFFCQLEAIETMIWLLEVAPHTASGKRWLAAFETENDEANPGLMRLAAKMATGSGKTTVMAMLIAWQAVNAARGRTRFSDAFLIVCPGITIRDRLKVLDPNDPENYFETRRAVPDDMLADIRKARIVITNYHAFKQRETMKIPKYAREVIEGRDGTPIQTLETEGDMLRRVCKELLGRKNVVVLNDEAHHCYQEKPGKSEEAKAGDEGDDIKKNKEAARLWINGIRALDRKIGVRTVYDLSATPFFLRGSGYTEGTLFPWVASDFSLIDAIESGIVKIPRVPVSDNSLGYEMPLWRKLWPEIREDMPKKGAKKAGKLDVGDLPEKLLGALHGLYEHYEQLNANWQGFATPPVFIVVCQNTSHSKLLFDYISGYERTETNEHGETTTVWVKGKLPLFSNVDQHGKPHPRPNTLLIDSNEIDSGEALSAEFKKIAAPEIEAYKASLPQGQALKITDEDLLREAMNTVGTPGRLGADVRCVVSVSMLTEGWDTNTVTHVLGVRAFGTELLCEQVVGRGLRRVSYDLNDAGLMNPEYANIFGIPFSFASENKGPVTTKPPKATTQVHAINERLEENPHLEIRFPRIEGYRVRLPANLGQWAWNSDSGMKVDQSLTPTRAEIEDIHGSGETITLDRVMNERVPTAAFHIAGHALRTKFRDPEGNLKPYLFPKLLACAKDWLTNQVQYSDGMGPGIFLWAPMAEKAAVKLYNAFVAGDDDSEGEPVILPILHPYNTEGSTSHVEFRSSKPNYETRADLCHINYVVADSGWELAMAETLEHMDEVRAYAKNHALNFEVPYAVPGGEKRYRPDFIVKMDDGGEDLLNLIVEVKGERDALDALKAEAMQTHWLPAVHNDGRFGRWAFVEVLDPYDATSTIRAAVQGNK